LSITTALVEQLTGGLKPEQLPERVQAIIRDREEESERLIGWVQLGLVVTFGALFFLAPRPTDAHMTIYEPVPIALSVYALFTIARLAIAYFGRVPWWLLVISILIDISLLMMLIWFFHIDYGQPAAFSLKVPTFIYVFVFIALRGLRFDYRYVLLTGASVAVGWTVMVWAVISTDGANVITRNFGTYLTSNRVLIGAEFDKILTVLLVTCLLAVGVRRAQAMLVLATREEAAGREIRRFLSDGVAEAITRSDELVEAGTAVERDAAIVMLDIRGFTRLVAMMPPRRAVDILTSFHARIVPLVQKHNGVIDKFLGDGVMITFGAVTASTTAAADALRALDEIMHEASHWRQNLREQNNELSLDVNGAAVAGAVVFATLGNGNRLELTVIGDAVNLAAKLEKHNKTAGTRALTSRATFELATKQGYVAVENPKFIQAALVSGVTEPIDLLARG
jgi:adenylate cyclase